MRIVIAPDKFKGCLSAGQVAKAIARGLERAGSGVIVEQIPMADGGEGTVEALVAATGGHLITQRVTGPLPEMQVEAPFGLLGDHQTAVIEMASASGLHLLRPDQYNPMRTTTFGTGQLLRAAASNGARRIILGIGGSATVDGGLGCAQACGVKFALEDGTVVGSNDAPLSGAQVGLVRVADAAANLPPQWLGGAEILVACDVDNPLTGPRGAAAIFGPQKGATPEQVKLLDAALERLSSQVPRGSELRNVPGAGAAGGLGFGMMAFFGATLRPGFGIVAEAVHLRQRLAGADLCITGEGKLDASSLGGKTTIGVARICKELAIPCIALVGSVGSGAEAALAEGLVDYQAIGDGLALEESMRRAPDLLADAAEAVVKP